MIEDKSMNYDKKIKKVKIIYFTGTGNTELIVNEIEKCFKQKELEVIKCRVTANELISHENEDILFVIFPVYGFNAPLPLLNAIDSLNNVSSIPAVVIANSGGGDVTPNTASNIRCIKKLEQKGFNVIYEKILVMPANYVAETPMAIAVQLLKVLPKNIEKIVNDVFMGNIRRVKPNLTNRLLSKIGLKEQLDAKKFSRKIRVESNCNGCGLCSRDCQMNNIEMIDKKPIFSDKCSMCLRCLYGCPQHALKPGIYKFCVIKDGYNLKRILDNTSKQLKIEEDFFKKNRLFYGVKKYLDESDNISNIT